jgi:hypothetical protein
MFYFSLREENVGQTPSVLVSGTRYQSNSFQQIFLYSKAEIIQSTLRSYDDGRL